MKIYIYIYGPHAHNAKRQHAHTHTHTHTQLTLSQQSYKNISRRRTFAAEVDTKHIRQFLHQNIRHLDTRDYDLEVRRRHHCRDVADTHRPACTVSVTCSLSYQVHNSPPQTDISLAETVAKKDCLFTLFLLSSAMLAFGVLLVCF